MESLIVVLVLLLLAFPVIAIVALVKSSNTRILLRQMESRLLTLERRLASAAPVATAATATTSAPAPQPSPMPAPQPVATAIPSVATPAPSVSSPITAPAKTVPLVAQPTAPARAAAPTKPTIGFEERFGTRWVVWVGGLALALGGIFMVSYAIEQGLVGPGVRVTLASLLALALIGLGEWTRRQENVKGFVGIPTAHIPSILTAAGTTVAFATVYGAYALYGFLSPPVAFVLLGLVAIATLTAALLHGPVLAGLGLIGAFVTPMLIEAEQPDYWALYLYLAVVTAAAFALARLRMWRPLALAAIAFGLMWIFPGIDHPVTALGAHVFHAVAGFVLAAALIVAGFAYGPPATPGRIDGVSSIAPSAYLFGAALLVIGGLHDPLALGAFTLMVAATLAIAWRAEAATAAVPAAAVMVALVMLQWAVELDVSQLVAPGGPTTGVIPGPETSGTGTHIALGGLFTVLFGASGFLAQGRSERAMVPILWAASAVAAPLAILVTLYIRVAHYERSIPFAALALLLAALYGIATELLSKRAPKPGLASASAIFATGAVAGLALALTLALEKGFLTIALALMVPGIAWIGSQRPLPFLRWLAGIMTAVVLARIGWEPRIVGSDIGTTPIFNWILYGYGVPAASFWLAGWLMRKRADDVPVRMVESGAILFTVLLAFLEIRHYLYRGNVYFASSGLIEVASQVCVGLALTIGLERIRERSHSVVHNVGALIIAGFTLAASVFGLMLAENPLVTTRPVGTGFVNLILLAYGIPAVLTAALALLTRTKRPQWYSTVAAITAVVFALFYLTLQVRWTYHGQMLASGPTTDAEQYTYSAVWLLFGVALLVVGLVLRSQPTRMASAAVVTLTIGKVFLVDMADLTGIYRALSFIGLGLVLVGIGYLYQRLLFPPRRPEPESASAPEPAAP
ncbi:MAG: hypothetical protein JWN71_4209 [Xanthobacteraceae bacterium]|nr:hypothetical protein [Xanthobacteraceae bacterium]